MDFLIKLSITYVSAGAVTVIWLVASDIVQQ